MKLWTFEEIDASTRGGSGYPTLAIEMCGVVENQQIRDQLELLFLVVRTRTAQNVRDHQRAEHAKGVANEFFDHMREQQP